MSSAGGPRASRASVVGPVSGRRYWTTAPCSCNSKAGWTPVAAPIAGTFAEEIRDDGHARNAEHAAHRGAPLPPARRFRARCAGLRRADLRRGRSRPRGFLGRVGGGAPLVPEVGSGAGVGATALPLVRGRHAERRLQLPRSAPRWPHGAPSARWSGKGSRGTSAVYTYEELHREVGRAANALHKLGIKRGIGSPSTCR
jgi:hypothetical protein